MNLSTLLFGQVSYLLSYYANLYMENDLKAFQQSVGQPDTYGLPQEDVFDFIVVGGGTAGCLVANKLASTYRVLLLEEGGDPPPQAEVPYLIGPLNGEDSYLYRYSTQPQTNLAQQRNGIVSTQSGKVLGGTSTINGNLYNRGHPLDFDNWANLTGDSSWTYHNLLPHFKNIEDYAGEFPSDQHHGSDGPIKVSKQNYAPGADIWYAAGKELGFASDVDPNGPQTTGFMPLEYSRDAGRRVSSYTTFIRNRTIPNLETRRYSNAQQILIEENNGVKRASGVQYTQHGFPKVSLASKEVIVSAGAYGSPKLLLRSGIGPKDELAEAKIPSVVDLPGVGKNLQDHACVPLAFKINSPQTSPAVPELNEELTHDRINEFLHNGTGPLTSVLGIIAQAFLASSVTTGEGNPNWPDIQYVLSSTDFTGLNVATPSEGEQLLYVYIFAARPKSSGTVRLNPNNTSGPLLIDPQYLSKGEDVQVLLEGIKTALKVFEETEAYKGIGAGYATRNPAKGCEAHEFRSDAYWECFARLYLTVLHHASGTCAMGKPDCENTVVDSELRVIGVPNLRVIDASIMPKVTNANPQAAVYVIAEKISNKILKDLEGN